MKRQIVMTPPAFPVDDPDVFFHVVLVEPEIPQNTGNIARLCAGTRCWLHLVEPLGYELEDRYLRRAGLDYWPGVRLSVHPSLSSLVEALPGRERVHLLTKGGSGLLWEVSIARGDVFVFGRETRGLPAEFVREWGERTLRIPISSEVRSLNLANSVAIVTYESLRRLGWSGEEPMPG